MLQALKKSSLSEATALAIPVTNDLGSKCSLVPVGAWILDTPDLLGEISEWRSRAMKMFLVQFESTPARTVEYIQTHSLAQSDRLLFMVDLNGAFVGHIGIANLTEESAELDNLMRGRPGGPTELFKLCELTLLKWVFFNTSVKEIRLRVLSYNVMAKVLHKEIGFHVSERLPLRQVETDWAMTLVPCSVDAASVSFTCDVMAIRRDQIIC